MPGRYRCRLLGMDQESLILQGNLILHNGFGNWSIEIPDDVAVGTKLTLECLVTDDVNPDGFTNILTLNVVQQCSNGHGEGKRHNRTAGGGETGDEEPFGIQLPDIKRVREPEWHSEGFDAFSSTKVTADIDSEDGQDKTVYTFVINVDNRYLKAEMKDSKTDASLVEAKFVYGNVLLGLALIRDYEERKRRRPEADKENEANGDVEIDIYEKIASTSRALAPFLVPMIDSLGALTSDDVASFGEVGDQD